MPTNEEIKAFFAGQNNQQNANNNQQPVKNYVTYVKDGKSNYVVRMTESYNPYENIQTFSDTENNK